MTKHRTPAAFLLQPGKQLEKLLEKLHPVIKREKKKRKKDKRDRRSETGVVRAKVLPLSARVGMPVRKSESL